ncbi:hypothetical protein [Amycolatopsis ultiminotia]|uniref:hypothetical protein n=1 Tax=Amycolatopsis ultiminotia TaxID=543629 RepID=UPI0031E77B6E
MSAAVSDVVQLAGYSVLIADTADPVRSGLARAARVDGPVVGVPAPAARMRFSWRAQALLGRVERVGAVRPTAPSLWWLPDQRSMQLTVVDLDGDAWQLGSNVRIGAGRWLVMAGCTLLVVRPTVPGLHHAEQVLACLEPWVLRQVVKPVAHLVVVGERKWPPRVAATAGPRVAQLLGDTIFVPRDSDIAAGGVTADVTPPKVRDPFLRLVQRWRAEGALPPDVVPNPVAR